MHVPRSRFALLLPLLLAAATLTATPVSASTAGAAPAGRVVELPIAECAVDINDSGVVLTSTKIYRAGRVTPIPSGMDTAMFINNRGQIVGFQAESAVFWNGSRTIRIPHLPIDNYAWPTGLNEHGDVVGWSMSVQSAEIRQHGWVWRNGKVRELPGLSDLTNATAINDSGQFAGWSYMNNEWQPIRWEANGKITKLAALGFNSEPRSLNNAGEAVGYSDTGTFGDYVQHAVKWYVSGAVKNLDLPGDSGWASSINDRGTSVGDSGDLAFYRKAGGPMNLIPDPAPDTSYSLGDVNRTGTASGCKVNETGGPDGGQRITAITYRPAS